jgi:shikimate dehydrogenase
MFSMFDALNGATRLVPIIGAPIAQVKSPAGVSRMFAERGQNAICVPFHVTPEDLPGFMAGIKPVENVDGIIVTVPHKFSAYTYCATATERAHFLRAVNVMRRNPDGTFYGDMCDGIGFVAAMSEAGCEFFGRRALLVGAGGAGSAIAQAVAAAGVSLLTIVEADEARRDTLVGRLREIGAPVSAGEPDPTGFDIVVNATPMGMREGDPFPVRIERLTPDMFVGDVVTMPEVPPLIENARRIGCRTQTGTGMFVKVRDLIVDFLLPA